MPAGHINEYKLRLSQPRHKIGRELDFRTSLLLLGGAVSVSCARHLLCILTNGSPSSKIPDHKSHITNNCMVSSDVKFRGESFKINNNVWKTRSFCWLLCHAPLGQFLQVGNALHRDLPMQASQISWQSQQHSSRGLSLSCGITPGSRQGRQWENQGFSWPP